MSAHTPTTSITPQRKHRKLLKDGSGVEVWPESIEKIFVQGLHEYWVSPYANSAQSRGRSRWRNQYLVDYLQKAGIDRSKKQVASHIQVLRNMWKGEPEFYLVAGGEEPVPENPVKLEDGSLISLDFDENDDSSNSTSSDFSPPELQRDFPPSPGQVTGGYAIGSHSPPSPKDLVSPYGSSSPTVYTTSVPSAMSIYPVDIPSHHHSHDQLPVRNAHYSLNGYHIQNPYSTKASTTSINDANGSETGVYSYQQSPSRATSVCLWADGMTPLSIKLDTLLSPQSSSRAALALHMRLSIAPDDGIRSTTSPSPGFLASVSLSRLWGTSGKCITRVYTNNMQTNEVVGSLDVSNIEMGIVNAMLPESSLSRCRWFDASIPTRITQEIIADNETMLYLIYDLDRTMGPIPSAKLMRFATVTKPTPSVPQSANNSVYHGYSAPSYSTQTTPPSIDVARHSTSPFF
ncbi:hypothetical protein H0H93_014508 [Arthromyces matolae]|nr:hypothetical protein H0H93_014508 [Arthromyces matolae]